MPLKSASSQQCQEVVLNAIFFVRAGLHVSFDDKSLENIFVGIFGKEKFDVDTDSGNGLKFLRLCPVGFACKI